jgi:ABC-2 type transport system ATP-binding protein
MKIISAKNICKGFSKSSFDWKKFHFDKSETLAVNNLSLEIEEGEFIGFLGPNGAGKTTFLKMLSGIIYPDSGTAIVLGFTPWERKFEFLHQIAIVMGQKNQLWWDLPAIDSYKLLKEVYEIDDARFKKNLDYMVDSLDMKDLLTKRLRSMSLGERMKCELVACFLHDPKVIFLDEPTIGLDVVSSQAIRTFLKSINKEKKCTIILTSHYMADVDELCKRVVIINKGKKIYDGELEKLKTKYAPEKKIQIFLPTLEDREKFAHLPIDQKRIWDGNGIITIAKDKLGNIITKVFELFPAENITISDPDTEEVISKIFSEK